MTRLTNPTTCIRCNPSRATITVKYDNFDGLHQHWGGVFPPITTSLDNISARKIFEIFLKADSTHARAAPECHPVGKAGWRVTLPMGLENCSPSGTMRERLAGRFSG